MQLRNMLAEVTDKSYGIKKLFAVRGMIYGARAVLCLEVVQIVFGK
jgi:hypothetical protein